MTLTPIEIIATIVNFLILVGVLGFFLWKPVNKLLNDRQTEINDSLALAEASRKEAAEMHDKLAAEINAANREARQIVEDAQRLGESIKADIVAQASAAAAKVTAAAEEEIELKKQEAIKQLQDQVADLVVMVSGKVLADGMTDAQQKALVDKYIKEVGGLQ